MRKMLNAVFYLLRSGCQWRMLPREFPPWSTVHHYFRVWRLDGTWEKINAVLRERIRIRGFAYAEVAIPNRAPQSSTSNP
jgi:putative transposase